MSVLCLSVFIFWQFFAFTPYILTQISEFSIPFLKTGSCLKAAFAFFGCAPDDLQTQNVAICDILAMRLNNQLIFWWIKEQLGQIILILLLHYIKMIWGSISWKKCLQRKTFYFDTLSTFQNLPFITFAWVKKLSQCFYFHQSLFLHKYLYFHLKERTCVLLPPLTVTMLIKYHVYCSPS